MLTEDDLTQIDLRHALYCVIEQHNRQLRKEVKNPVPWTSTTIEKLCGAIAKMSQPRQSEPDHLPQSKHADELLSARQVSARIGWDRRRVQRHAELLGGELIDGRWMFSATAVDEHIEGMTA